MAGMREKRVFDEERGHRRDRLSVAGGGGPALFYWQGPGQLELDRFAGDALFQVGRLGIQRPGAVIARKRGRGRRH